MELRDDKPYFDFRGVTEIDENIILPVQVKYDEDTRIRVYCTQLMDEVLYNITSKNNVLFHADIWYKLGEKLVLIYPNRSEDLFNASILFWARVQTKIKEMK